MQTRNLTLSSISILVYLALIGWQSVLFQTGSTTTNLHSHAVILTLSFIELLQVQSISVKKRRSGSKFEELLINLDRFEKNSRAIALSRSERSDVPLEKKHREAFHGTYELRKVRYDELLTDLVHFQRTNNIRKSLR